MPRGQFGIDSDLRITEWLKYIARRYETTVMPLSALIVALLNGAAGVGAFYLFQWLGWM